MALLRTFGSGLQTLPRRYSSSWKTLGLMAPMRMSRDAACFPNWRSPRPGPRGCRRPPKEATPVRQFSKRRGVFDLLVRIPGRRRVLGRLEQHAGGAVAREGISLRCWRRSSLTALDIQRLHRPIFVPVRRSGQMEDLGNRRASPRLGTPVPSRTRPSRPSTWHTPDAASRPSTTFRSRHTRGSQSASHRRLEDDG